MAGKSIVLGVNDYPNSTDYLVLTDGNNFINRPDDGLNAPPPSVHRFHSRTKGTLLTTEDIRVITLKVQVFGGAGIGSADVMLNNIQAIEKKGRQARLWSGPTPRGAGPVVLAVRLNGASNYTYFDVQDIRVTAATHIEGPTNHQELTVECTCLPWGRGPVITDDLTPIYTNGNPGYLFRAGIMGDTDAIMQLQITDVSLSSKFINRIHVGRVAGDGMALTDFSPILFPTPAAGTSVINDGTVINGSYVRLASTSTFTPIATFPVPGGNYYRGAFHAYGVIRDNGVSASSRTLLAPTNVAASWANNPTFGAGYSFAATSYTITLTSLDVSGNESLGTTISTSVGSTGQAVTISWVPGIGAARTRIYLQPSGQPWYLYEVSGATSSLTLNELAPTINSPIFGANPSPPGPPTGISVTDGGTGGTWPADTYQVWVSSTDSNELEGPVTGPFPITLVANHKITVNYTLTGAYANIYVQASGGAWYTALWNTGSGYTLTAPNTPASNTTTPPVAYTGVSGITATPAYTAGSLTAGTYNYRILSGDVHGRYSTSSLNSVTLTGTGQIAFSFTPGTGPLTKILLQTPGGTWYLYILGGSLGSITIASLSAPSPPAAALSLSNALFLCGIAPAGPSGATAASQYADGKPKPAQIAGGTWELLYLGLFTTPAHTPEGQGVPPAVFRIQGKQGQAPNLDVAGLVLIPEDEPHMTAEYRGLSIPAAYTWLLDDPRDRFISATLQASGSYVGAARVSGELRAAPGNDMFIILCEGPGGVFDMSNTRFQAQLRYQPLYGWLRGGDADQPVLDTFNRANSLSSLGNVESGQTYNVSGGTFGVSTKHFYVNTVTTSNKAFAYVNAPTHNGVIRSTLLYTPGSSAYILFRLADANNWYALFATSSGYQLWQNVAGTLSTIATSTRIPAANDAIVITLSGTTVTVAVNGLNVTGLTNISVPNNATAVAFGLGGNAAATETWGPWSVASA